jgi:hypothetical protein
MTFVLARVILTSLDAWIDPRGTAFQYMADWPIFEGFDPTAAGSNPGVEFRTTQ